MGTESFDKFLREACAAGGASPLQDPEVNAVIDRAWLCECCLAAEAARTRPRGVADRARDFLGSTASVIDLM